MSNKNSFITQAFKQFGEMLDEELEVDGVKEVPVYEADTDNIHDFLDTAGEDEPVDVIDLEAETVEDLKQSYVGKVVLDCNVCHSNIFIDKDEVVVDENGVANVDMECPYCISNEGYTVIGKITPFEEDEEETEEVEVESEEEPEVEETEIEIEEVPEDGIEEGLISKAEHARGYSNVYADVAKGITGDREADAYTDELDKQLKEGCSDSKENLDECGDTETVQEELELDGEPELRGVGKLRHRDDKEGVEEIRGKNNTDLSGTDDLHESKSKKRRQLKEKAGAVHLPAGFYFDGYDNVCYSGKIVGCSWDDTTVQLYDPSGFSDEQLKALAEYSLECNGSGEVVDKYGHCVYSVEDLDESIQDVQITTDDETMTMTTKEDGGIAVETTPNESFEEFDEETFEEPVEEETFEDTADFETGDEMIAPIDDEEEEEVELNSEVDALSDEEIDELESPDEIEIDEFDEDSFDELGESYLTKHYDNVEGFKTVNAKVYNNSLIIEGVIRFNSGNSKCTSFVFEASKFNPKKKSALFEGYNSQISRGKKTYKMDCLMESGKIKPVKLTYNYRAKNELNESIRVNGTAKVKR